ncbi:MAG: SH3 domain-containing protein [Rectinema sp.]
MKKISFSLGIILIMMLISAGISGCKPDIRLPADKSLGGSAQWLVVTSLYCQVKSEPSAASRDIDILRRGMVLKIVESKFSTEETDRGTLWYRIQHSDISGWVSARDVDTYTDETQANSAARRME